MQMATFCWTFKKYTSKKWKKMFIDVELSTIDPEVMLTVAIG